MDTKQVGDRIRRIRYKKGLTQQQMANVLGVKQSNISQWESGKHAPSMHRIRQYGELDNVTAYEVIYGYFDTCKWVYMGDGDTFTTCIGPVQFTGDEHMGFEFCPYCGRRIKS